MLYALWTIPKRIKPTRCLIGDKYIDNPMTHLVAISMSHNGQPIRLFTVIDGFFRNMV